MREIKFRGKTRNGKWVYGYAAKFAHDSVPVILEDTENGIAPRKIIPETVGQFTGLHDKNGKEIYEGDIVDTSIQGISKVLYDSGQYTIESKNYSTAIAYRFPIHIIIIGNIHDNPELLKTE
ncbi:MAG: hypothetical protein J6U69_02305 [Alistipes sp.]|nr:hypothetical protein [Alistipes sp.]